MAVGIGTTPARTMPWILGEESPQPDESPVATRRRHRRSQRSREEHDCAAPAPGRPRLRRVRQCGSNCAGALGSSPAIGRIRRRTRPACLPACLPACPPAQARRVPPELYLRGNVGGKKLRTMAALVAPEGLPAFISRIAPGSCRLGHPNCRVGCGPQQDQQLFRTARRAELLAQKCCAGKAAE